MDWSFTPDQEQLAALARQILQRGLSEERMREVEKTDDRFDEKLFAQFGEAGLIGVALPSELGGGDGGLTEQCLVLIEIGRAVAPVPVLPTVVATGAIAAFGTDEQKRAHVAAAVEGRKVLAPALSEDLNLDAALPRTKAQRNGHGWTLTGQKTTVPAGTIADAFLVPAMSDDGVKVFIVERAASGVRTTHQKVTSTEVEAVLDLDGATGEELGGREVVDWLTRHMTVGLCAVQLGICERAVELTAEYSKTRVQFDRPIATFQAVGQRLADAYIDVKGIGLTMWQAAWRCDVGLPCDNEIATAKFWASDAGHRVAHTAVHVHGGMGIDLDYHLNRYFVAAKRIEFALGGATEQLVALGSALAGEPA